MRSNKIPSRVPVPGNPRIPEREYKSFSHECRYCGKKKNVDDYRTDTPSWCKKCDEVRTFRKL